MKTFFILLLFTLSGEITVAQLVTVAQFPSPTGSAADASKNKKIRICTPSRAGLIGQESLYVIKSHGKEIMGNQLNSLDPQAIKSIHVSKDSKDTEKYGQAGKYGVVEITLDDEKYPNAYKTVQIDSVKKNN
ncbi:hypothetical protein [Mucilaginibacter arboris]|uniref:TonB-dependent receptor plug domain-containing protein n=1 Tax=Mucilaginibacter arboris TaxID=2682090 RepID=A0A7K1SW88_9SPHI|nr:hypothetical protein [Mucilaginibacter arboris]MVN21585.1 hypothetical protein [Mucilaginibacter arboris]